MYKISIQKRKEGAFSCQKKIIKTIRIITTTKEITKIIKIEITTTKTTIIIVDNLKSHHIYLVWWL